MAQQKYCSSMTITPQQPVLVASVKGDKIGGNTLYAKMGTSNAPLKPGDPRVNKLVYNMYRGMLNTKHGRANDIVDSAPKQKVCTDEGVQDRVTAMMRQQSSKKEGKMNSPGGPPPPPPPPPFQVPGAVPYTPKPVPVPQEVPAQPTMQEIQTANMPSVLAGAMLKDKKPFTYTPGGLDLSEIKSPRMARRLQRNASLEGAKPSPLAQSPSPQHSSSPTPAMPPSGMVQVLPTAGMGLTPVPVPKPQPKEPPKQKRTVCGPAPLPPPFACGDNSAGEKPVNNEPINSANSDVNSVKQSPVANDVQPINPPSTNRTIPTPPPPPAKAKENTPHLSEEVQKSPMPNASNANDFLDLKELEKTMDSLQQNDSKDRVENDAVSEITDASSPFYPENSRTTDSSHEISSETDYEAEKEKSQRKNRWSVENNQKDLSNQTLEDPQIPKPVTTMGTVNSQKSIPVQKETEVNGYLPQNNTMPSPQAQIPQSPINNQQNNLINYPPTPPHNNVNTSEYPSLSRIIQDNRPPTQAHPRTIRQTSVPNTNYENQNNEHSTPGSADLSEKPLPWMVGMRQEQPDITPEFIVEANKAQQRFQRQRSLPHSREAAPPPPTNASNAPWRNPSYRQSQPANISYEAPESSNPMQFDQQYSTLPKDFHLHQVQNQQTLSNDKPRERIIPIMLERTPPVSPAVGPFDNPMRFPQQYVQMPNMPNLAVPNTPGNFPQYQDPYGQPTLDAVHQIQHNLARLNQGIRAEEDVRAQNNSPSGVNVVVVNDAAPIQSKSFKVIQSAYSEPSNDVVNSGYVEPKTYSGSNIPSRSFKVLQAMTDAQANTWNNEGRHSDDWFQKSKSSSSSVSPQFSSSQSDSPSRFTASTYRPSEMLHRNGISNNRSSAESQNSGVSYGFNCAESPSRLLPLIQQESDNLKDSKEFSLVCNGNKPPMEYSNEIPHYRTVPNRNIYKPASNYPKKLTPEDQAYSRDILKTLNSLKSDSSSDSSRAELEEHRDGIVRTAANKQSVLKELTAHFDPKTNLKKPAAAPGRAFRHLQQQYDSIDSSGYSSSPSFEEPQQLTKPNGVGVPGRTFRMLQENIDTHPSVLQARK